MSEVALQRVPLSTLAELLDALADEPDLAIEADLRVSVDGHRVTVSGYDDLVAIDCPSFLALRPLRARDGDRAMDLAAGLASTGLTLELRVRGVPVARLGDAADPSPVARALGLGPVQLFYADVLLALVRRRRG